MSVLTPRSSDIFNPVNRRRRWQLGSQRQQSFSLDLPQNIYVTDKLSRGLDSICFEEPLRSREEDRVFLYLPRNLSYCEVCADVIRDHVQKKVRLLSNRLFQYDDVPPTPVVETRPVFAVGEESEDEDTKPEKLGSLQSCCTEKAQRTQNNHIQPILKKKMRAVSFPAPRKEGRKVVRFADALGLELESIKYLVQKDLPKVVPSGTKLIPDSSPKFIPKKVQLVPAFLAPSLSTAFMEQLKRLKVSLHSVSTADSTVYGIVSVMNITFHKTVFVRYSVNSWVSYKDELATYLDGSSENESDKFSFTLFCNPSDLTAHRQSLFFAVCYQTATGDAYWDNNGGKNYCIRWETREIPVVGNHSWVHFL